MHVGVQSVSYHRNWNSISEAGTFFRPFFLVFFTGLPSGVNNFENKDKSKNKESRLGTSKHYIFIFYNNASGSRVVDKITSQWKRGHKSSLLLEQKKHGFMMFMSIQLVSSVSPGKFRYTLNKRSSFATDKVGMKLQLLDMKKCTFDFTIRSPLVSAERRQKKRLSSSVDARDSGRMREREVQFITWFLVPLFAKPNVHWGRTID